jgi:hypothetical protein
VPHLSPRDQRIGQVGHARSVITAGHGRRQAFGDHDVSVAECRGLRREDVLQQVQSSQGVPQPVRLLHNGVTVADGTGAAERGTDRHRAGGRPIGGVELEAEPVSPPDGADDLEGGVSRCGAAVGAEDEGDLRFDAQLDQEGGDAAVPWSALSKITRWPSHIPTQRRSPARDSYTTSVDAAGGRVLVCRRRRPCRGRSQRAADGCDVRGTRPSRRCAASTFSPTG